MYRYTETICRLIEHVHPISMNSVNCIAMCTMWLSIGLVSCPVNVLDLPDGVITGGRLFKSLHYFCIPLLYFRQPFQFLWRQPLHLQGAPLIRSVQPPQLLQPTFIMASLLGDNAFISPHPSSTTPPVTATGISFRTTPAMQGFMYSTLARVQFNCRDFPIT